LAARLSVHLLQAVLRFAQTIERALVLRDRFIRVRIVSRRRLGLLHFIGSLIELAAQFLHLRIATFTRKTLELTRRAPRLVNQLLLLSLIAATRSALIARTLHPATLLFERLFLTSRQLFKLAFSFRFLLLLLLALLPLAPSRTGSSSCRVPTRTSRPVPVAGADCRPQPPLAF
jgi:hypothetical protein